ncbi:MAG TPA: methyltransferase domain-containing protein, partial [Kofleriaceae bacterium]|nr:methyltransferase domain-containing protein [Kofleriaceae bacterium]
MKRAVLGLVVAAAACSQRTAAVDREPTPAAADAGAAAVADGVLARVAGAAGPIRVEQRAGRRLLYIGDTLQAAVAWAGDRPDPAAVDPLVALLRAARPQARTALVIGLGSGHTAGDLAAAGLQVTAVDIDPAVIEVARRWFGYRGDAVAADGRAYLEQHQGPWDLVIMDAFDGTRPAP